MCKIGLKQHNNSDIILRHCCIRFWQANPNLDLVRIQIRIPKSNIPLSNQLSGGVMVKTLD